MRYHKRKVDANQAEIVGALSSIGCGVVDLSAVGGGVPDLLVCYQGVNMLLEVKAPGHKVRKDARGEKQREFHAWWGGPLAIVSSTEEAIGTVRALRSARESRG